VIGEDQEPAHDQRSPSDLAFRDLRGEPLLCIEDSVHLLERPDIGFDLADRHRTERLVRSEDVDRAPLTEFGERDLDSSRPATAEEGGYGPFDQAGMALIDQSVCVGTAPPDAETPTAPGRLEDSAQTLEHDEPSEAGLHALNVASGHPSNRGQVRLGHASTASNQTEETCRPIVVSAWWHAPMIAGCDWPTLI